MEQHIQKIFINATRQILHEIGFPRIRTRERKRLFTKANQDMEMLAMIGLVGAIKGHFLLHFPPECSITFVQHLSDHLGMESGNLKDLKYRQSALGEIANQIGGKAALLLSEQGVECMITPPTVLYGQGIMAALPEADCKHAYTVRGDFGFFSCILAIKNSKLI